MSFTDTRPAPPKHKDWVPHDYQCRAVAFLMDQPNGALLLDPGLGKTSIVLAAFAKLKEMGVARKMLVIAPKRVCYLVWRQEGQEWKQFAHLKIGLLHGRHKDKVFEDDSHDILLVNPEGIPWLSRRIVGSWKDHFDTITLDELTKFKNAQAKRFKLLHPRIKNCARRWGLTGTPAPNGLRDLFGQMLILDDGQSLGKYFTHFRDRYFVPGFDGFSYHPQKGAEERIQERLKLNTLRMKAEDYITMPIMEPNKIVCEMDTKSRKAYDDMRREMVAEMEGGVVSAVNAAAAHNKLKQMAGGAVYVGDPVPGQKRKVVKIHDAKIDALVELVEGLAGQPLLVAYEFNHELERILERFPDTPYLGKGVSDPKTVEIEEAWNRNEIPMLLAHPASAGHGLNLQKGGASHLCWFSPTWDFELYDQFVRRLRRQGNTSSTIREHIIVMKNSIDDLVLEAIQDKDNTQARLLHGLSEVLGITVKTNPAAGSPAVTPKEDDMTVQRLGASGGGIPAGWAQPAATPTPPPPTPQETAPAAAPAGWAQPGAQPAPASTEAAPAEAPATVDRAAMEAKLTQPGTVVTPPAEQPTSSAPASGGSEYSAVVAREGDRITTTVELRATSNEELTRLVLEALARLG